MQICAKCKKEMTCVKTGVVCKWGANHCYAGDMFECMECGIKTINTNNEPFWSSNTTSNDLLIQMN